MANRVFFTADLHLGHANCAKWRGMTLDEMHERIVDGWNTIVTKRDVVWIVGDVVWSSTGIPILVKLNGIKHVILGNHDKVRILLPHVNKIKAYHVWKTKWLLSHVPVHSGSLRNADVNLHGHVHGGHCVKYDIDSVYAPAPDLQYFNLNCENHNYKPLSVEEIDATI